MGGGGENEASWGGVRMRLVVVVAFKPDLPLLQIRIIAVNKFPSVLYDDEN